VYSIVKFVKPSSDPVYYNVRIGMFGHEFARATVFLVRGDADVLARHLKAQVYHHPV